MAPLKGRNRAADFDDILEPTPRDFDPEADDIPDEEDVSADDLDSEIEAGDDDAREHYVDVGKSKLRKPKEVALGPQYRGSKVSRDAMTEDEDEDDPFVRGFDGQESGDEDLAGAEDETSGEDVDSEDDDLETPDTDLSDEEGARPNLQNIVEGQDRSELVKAMDERKTVATSLSQANRADAEKGRAVKKQRAAFDALLGTRMKLQKALIGVNTAVGVPSDELDDKRQEASDAIEAAENAAFGLWAALNSFRDDLIAAKTGQKRKRSTYSTSTPTSKLWSHMQSQEDGSLNSRTATLQKWSAKTRGPTATRQRSERINDAAQQSGVMVVIQEQLSNSERLVKRTHTPRSCAPLQVANKVTEDERIYDDADFYGLMLKELLEQKSQDSVAASNIDVNFQMRREAKTKKNVDTKASKGRKLRYTVHEKLQNFMAPEDRSTWGERQTDELFGSLFGQRMGLGEEREEADEDMGDGADAQEAGLMMFRS
ncbi:hypothetical protein LTR85_002548 [Meristemomyces frigidus]|nr:hypothetical protein LTR85_002548 [Meristemomyces frigidus]